MLPALPAPRPREIAPIPLARRSFLGTLAAIPAALGMQRPADASPPAPRRPLPEPLTVLVSHIPDGWGAIEATAVLRRFPRGTGYCGRCPRGRCNAVADVCLVAVMEHVDPDDAWDLSTLERPWVVDDEDARAGVVAKGGAL